MREFSIDGGKTRIVSEQCFDEEKTKGRPKKRINSLGAEIIEKLAAFMCTEEEIASFLDVSVETLKNAINKGTFSECYKKGQETGKAHLRMSQFRLAKTNASMAIFLGKQYLGQRDAGLEYNATPVDTVTKIEIEIEDASGGTED